MNSLPRVELRTPRLLIRPLADTDVDDIAAACSDEDTRRFLATPSPYTVDDAREFLAKAELRWETGAAEWAIADPRTNRYLGGIGLAKVDRRRGVVEIGYAVAPWARGRGVAAEAATAVTAFVFEQGFQRAELVAAAPNIASQRTALAAGFAHESTQRSATVVDGRRCDYLTFARLSCDPPPPVRRALPDLPEGRLTDGVVSLTPFTADDVDAHFAHSSLPEVWGTSMPPIPPDRAAIEVLCRYGAQNAWLTGHAARMVIRDAATGAFAGAFGVYRQGGPLPQVMLGYSLHREFRGRGFMTRAVRLAVDWSFDAVRVHRIVAGTALHNHASQAVLERVGFTRDGVERERLLSPDGGYVDNVMWSMLPGDRA